MSTVRELVLALPEEEVREFVLGQRWYGSKSDEVVQVQAVDAFPLRDRDEPLLAVAVVETRFQTGTHELYNVPVGLRRGKGGFASVDGWSAFDALEDDELVRGVVEMIRAQERVEHDHGTLEFSTVGGLVEDLGELGAVRAMGSEQSNSSVVLGEQLVLKVYRRLEAGVNPELELLRFLTQRGFPSIASLEGWAAHVGQPLDATLAILQHYVPVRTDGWTLALADLAAGSDDGFVPLVRRLGEVTGAMHSVLASESSDPAFLTEEPSAEALALIVARIDEEIEQVFSSLPDDPLLEPIAGRGDELRDRLQAIGQSGPLGRLIRHHGDYHLGQVLWTERDDWVVLDFEGEPARPLTERRHKRSPLRDVAGMLRSFSYAASASSLEHGIDPPVGWEGQVRSEFLAGYLAEVDPAIVPSSGTLERRLVLFELEKALYELRYELGHRPDWVRVPVAGIVQLLEEPL
ncbi:MAG TPA: phosphotransferase [Gaiellaceae bacterium]|nr:phosphotransferase [Gaiellaceae bacterium]